MNALLEMCLQGSAMVAVVLVLRALFAHRLPRATFLALWCAVLLRLLVPLQVEVPFNAWTLAEQGLEGQGTARASATAPETADPAHSAIDAAVRTLSAWVAHIPHGNAHVASGSLAETAMHAQGFAAAVAPEPLAGAAHAAPSALHEVANTWQPLWVAGALASAAAVTALYIWHLRRFAHAASIDNRAARQWLQTHPLRRRMRIVQSPLVESPLTYGVLRPTIVIPEGFDWRDRAKSTLVLEHEYVHVARFDAAFKAVLAATACLYWFNPLVWAMYAVANRDIELSCDERVARMLNGHGRRTYAHALIDMAARSATPAFAASGFGRSAIHERVQALQSVRPASVGAGAATALLVVGVSWAFATGSPKPDAEPPASSTAAAADPVPTISDQEVQWAEATLVTEGARAYQMWVITTPRYCVGIPIEYMPLGFTWEFSREHASPAPKGMVDVLTVRDADTKEIAFVAYCYPRDPAYPHYTIPGELGDMPGYVLEDLGRSDSDLSYGVALAIPEALWTGENLTRAYAAGVGPQVSGFGFLSQVYGVEPTPITADAFMAQATKTENGLRITTPYYAVTIPYERLSEPFAASYYEGWGPQGSHRLYVELNDGESFRLYCRSYGTAVDGSGYSVELAADQATADGREAVVNVEAIYRYENGEYYISHDQAYATAAAYLNWVEIL